MIEVFWKLVWMDQHLPPDVPFLIPAGDIPEGLVAALQHADLGVLHPDRRWIFTTLERKIVQVKRLYYYGSTAQLNQPMTSWFGFNYFSNLMREAFARRADAAPGGKPAKRTIVILERISGASRSFGEQQPLLIDAIQARLAEAGHADVKVVPIMPDPTNFMLVGSTLRDAAVVIGSHGGAMNNLFMVPAGAAVIEIGYVLDWWHWPTEFVCLARSLGLHYYPLIGECDGMGPMTIDVDHVAATAVSAWLDVAPALAGARSNLR